MLRFIKWPKKLSRVFTVRAKSLLLNTFSIHQWSSHLSFTGTNYISVRPYLVVNKMNRCVCVHVCVCWCILTRCRQADEDDWKGWWRATGAVSTVSFYHYTAANENQYRQQLKCLHVWTHIHSQPGTQLYIKVPLFCYYKNFYFCFRGLL